MSETQELPRWWKLAGVALTAARDLDYQAAAHAGERIGEIYGWDVLPQIMLAWIDVTTAKCGFDPQGEAVHIAWQNEDSAEVTDADSTPPGAVWAGRLIGARLADDEDTYRAVMHAVTDDAEWSRNVGALLTTCGAMLRRYAA
jgi:hypothetical protein